MPSITNLSFEDGAAGAATSWTYTTVATFEEWAGYAGGLAYDSFESGWANAPYETSYAAADLEAAHYTATLFDPPLEAEGFEAGWSMNEHYLTVSADFEQAQYATTSSATISADGFEIQWLNDAYAYTFAGGALSAALYAAGGKSAENFEDHWRSNETYVTTWAALGLGIALADYGGARAVGTEDFEYVEADRPFTLDLSISAVFDVTAHGFAVGYRVQFLPGETGTLPTGLIAGTNYWINAVIDADHFTISAVSAVGPTLVPFDVGAGVNDSHEPNEFWTNLMETI